MLLISRHSYYIILASSMHINRLILLCRLITYVHARFALLFTITDSDDDGHLSINNIQPHNATQSIAIQRPFDDLM